MNKPLLLLGITAITVTTALKAQHAGAEKLELIVDTSRDFMVTRNLTVQEAPTFNERGGRGVFMPIVAGYLITKGVQGIQKLIDNRKNRYMAQYDFAERGHYFYDQIATSPIDPVGLQFKGFKIIRLVKKEGGQADTMFYAKFILDTAADRFDEMMNNGMFHLRLDSIMVSKSRVKAPKNVDRLNMDFEIDFNTSYRSDDGQIHADALLGKFIFTLRNAPLYNGNNATKKFYDSLDAAKPPVTGECFMVPRSAGFYKTKNGVIKSCYGQGLYSVSVSVKETSKTKFVDRVIIFSSDPALNVGSQLLQKKYAGSGSSSGSSSSGKSKQSN